MKVPYTVTARKARSDYIKPIQIYISNQEPDQTYEEESMENREQIEYTKLANDHEVHPQVNNLSSGSKEAPIRLVQEFDPNLIRHDQTSAYTQKKQNIHEEGTSSRLNSSLYKSQPRLEAK